MCVMIDSSILDTKWDIFPICLCQKGITLRLDYNTSPNLGRAIRAFGGATVADGAASVIY